MKLEISSAMTYLNSYFRLIKARDRLMARHAERVRAVTELLATLGLEILVQQGLITKERQFSDEALQGVIQGSLLHELGKVTLEDCILYPETQLSDEQTFKLRSYPQVGYEILAELPISRPEVLKVVLHHHEKWDGSGYPLGLAEWAIPLEAQIVGIADCFIHLSEPRAGFGADPFRGMDWLTKLAGEHFNPHLVDVFEVLFDEIREVAFPEWKEGETSMELNSPLFPADLDAILEEEDQAGSADEQADLETGFGEPDDVLFRQAKAESADGNWREALATLRSAISLNPGRIEVRDFFLDLALRSGEYRLYIEQQLECARFFLARRQPEEAQRRCDSISQLEYQMLENGLAAEDQRAFKESFDLLGPEIAFLKGSAYEAQGEHDMASMYYGKSCELKPDDWRFNLALGRNYFQLGIDVQALEILEKVLQMAPTEAAPAWEVIGEIMHRRQGGQSDSFFRKAAQLYEEKMLPEEARRVRQRLREL